MIDGRTLWLLLGLASGLVLGLTSPQFALGKQAETLIEKCEQNIPRSQKCELIAESKGKPDAKNKM